ncbi:hypothetical protein CDL15_Pgr008921 [Punica granatum]|uniref:Uncharacterized protein n=1 Tax=Punica granatum TaxID=22663 RepID=A0A218VZ85_PUNGR|nr:hypothetical protein CDL15_Pgr008921 [Punica granatum]
MYADRAISNPIGGCDALSTTKPKLLASPDPTWQYESLSGSCRKEVGEDEALQLQLRGASMAVAAPSPAAFLPRTADKPRSFPFSFSSAPRYNHGRLLPARKPLTIVAMAPRKKVPFPFAAPLSPSKLDAFPFSLSLSLSFTSPGKFGAEGVEAFSKHCAIGLPGCSTAIVALGETEAKSLKLS